MSPETKKIAWVVFVLVTTVLLGLLTRYLLNRAIQKTSEKHYAENLSLSLLKNVLVTFISLIGLFLASYAFFEQEMFEFVTENLYKVSWIGFVVVSTIIASSVTQVIFNRLIRKASLDNEQDPTSYRFLNYLTTGLIYLLGLSLMSYAFPSLQLIAKSALAGAGIFAVAIGIASQEAVANIISGVLIIFFKPFKLGDILKISDDMSGEVTDITLRHTVIKNYRDNRIVVPNSIINKEKLINYNMGDRKSCQWVEVGISYGSDIDLAKSILRDEAMKHPSLIDGRNALALANGDEIVLVRVISLDDSAVLLRAWVWAKDHPTGFAMKCDLLESVKKRYDREGIEIPFPHRTVFLKGNSASN